MRKCTACGNELATYAVYCTKCGKINPITSSQSQDEDEAKEKSERDSKKQHDPIKVKTNEPPEQKSYIRLDYTKRDSEIKTDSNVHTDLPIGQPSLEKVYPRLADAKQDSVVKTDSDIHTDSPIGQSKKSDNTTQTESPLSKQIIGSVLGTYATSSVKSDSVSKPTAQPIVVQPRPSESRSTTSTTPDKPYQVPDGVRVFDRDKAKDSGAGWAGFPKQGGNSEFLSPDEVKFTTRFSFAPGCVFYLFSRAMGAFLLVNLSLLFIYAFTLPDNATSDNAVTDLLTKIYFLLQVPVLLWMGSVSRARRWKVLKFQSFNHFKSDEIVWGILGGIGWFFIVLIALFALFG